MSQVRGLGHVRQEAGVALESLGLVQAPDEFLAQERLVCEDEERQPALVRFRSSVAKIDTELLEGVGANLDVALRDESLTQQPSGR